MFYIIRYMTKYSIRIGLSMPSKAAHQRRLNRLTAKNEHDFRHMFVSRPDGGSVFRVGTDCSCNSSPCKQDKRNGDKGLCPSARGYLVPGIYFDRDDIEQRTACSGLRD